MSKTTKLILLDSLLQEVEELVPTLCFRQLGVPPVNKIYGNDALPDPGGLIDSCEPSPAASAARLRRDAPLFRRES